MSLNRISTFGTCWGMFLISSRGLRPKLLRHAMVFLIQADKGFCLDPRGIRAFGPLTTLPNPSADNV